MINGFPLLLIAFLAGMFCGAMIEIIIYLFSVLAEIDLNERWEDKQ